MKHKTNVVKHLEIKKDNAFSWRQHINEVLVKLNKINAIISKVKHQNPSIT